MTPAEIKEPVGTLYGNFGYFEIFETIEVNKPGMTMMDALFLEGNKNKWRFTPYVRIDDGGALE